MQFKFSTHIHQVNQNKSASNNLGKVCIGIVRESQKLSAHSYIRCIVQSSLRQHSFLVYIDSLICKIDPNLFHAMAFPDHCLHTLLPNKCRFRGHNYTLAQISSTRRMLLLTMFNLYNLLRH